MIKRFRVVHIALLGLLTWNTAQIAQAVGVLYNDPGWLHAYDGAGDYYHDPDGPNPNYLADPDPTNNQPGGQANQPALINPGPCGGAGQPTCADAAIWQTAGSQWEGSAPGDPLGGAPGPPPVPAPAPGGVGAFMDSSTTFLRIQDTGVPQDWGWADKGAQGSPTGARQEGNNRRIQFKHEMNRDAGFSDRADIMDFGVTISFRTRIATEATGPLDDAYPEGGGTTPTPWPTEGIGYDVGNNGRGMFFLTQNGVGGPNQLAFGILDENTRAQYSSGQVPAKNGLVMNNRFSASQSVNTNDATATTMNIVEIDNDELDEWHEFWVTIQKLPSPVDGNTHEVKVYFDGSLEPETFQVIMGLQNEFGSGSHLGMGLSSGSRFGAYDIDFYAYKEGIHAPTVPGGLPGDYNDDGTVDAADYVIWRKNAGTMNTLPNDGGIGGTVGAAHFNLWKSNFGEMAGAGSGSASLSVPEPSSILLLVLGAVAGVTRRGCGFAQMRTR